MRTVISQREDVEKHIRDRLSELLFKKKRLSVAQSNEVQAQVFEHIKLCEYGHLSGLDAELTGLLNKYYGLTIQLYRLRHPRAAPKPIPGRISNAKLEAILEDTSKKVRELTAEKDRLRARKKTGKKDRL
ncbi:hypothetical protein [Bradyrhizobium sp. DASA03120]|uniref:hypothetical protein n=1 Tax=Bradyrhizobium sp. SMVTL-02 TaxID=3395917 RepID=UPI003F6EC143